MRNHSKSSEIRLVSLHEVIVIDELKKTRNQKSKHKKIGEGIPRTSRSPANKYTSGDNFIDRNCNLVPHYKEYE
jgi:hypothetical protein